MRGGHVSGGHLQSGGDAGRVAAGPLSQIRRAALHGFANRGGPRRGEAGAGAQGQSDDIPDEIKIFPALLAEFVGTFRSRLCRC